MYAGAVLIQTIDLLPGCMVPIFFCRLILLVEHQEWHPVSGILYKKIAM